MAMTLPVCDADKRRKPDTCGAAAMIARRYAGLVTAIRTRAAARAGFRHSGTARTRALGVDATAML